MHHAAHFSQRKSAHRLAFEHYLRTGARLSGRAVQLKFNPYHDPDNGQFTFAPGGPRTSIGGTVRRPSDGVPVPIRTAFDSATLSTVVLANHRPNPRERIGGNGGPLLNDPMTLERASPGLRTTPGGSIIAVADNFFDLTGPANRLTTELAQAEVKSLIAQIREVDPKFRFDSLRSPNTLEGQATRSKASECTGRRRRIISKAMRSRFRWEFCE